MNKKAVRSYISFVDRCKAGVDVEAQTNLERLPSLEGLVAVGADVAALVVVDEQVLAQRAAAVEHAAAHVAHVRRVLVRVHVRLQVRVCFEPVHMLTCSTLYNSLAKPRSSTSTISEI